MNPILENQSNKNEQIQRNLNAVQGIFDLVSASANPNAMLMQVARNNPNLMQVMQMCQGRNPKEMFFAKCKENGIDPNAILSRFNIK